MGGETITLTTEPLLQTSEIPETNSAQIAQRDEFGRLLPGTVLNPAGRPKGAKHFKTLFIEAIKEIGLKNEKGEDISKDKVIVEKIIKQAMEGNLKAADMIIGRVDGDKEDVPLLQVNVIALTKEQQDALQELI